MSGRRAPLLVLALLAAFAVGGCSESKVISNPTPVPSSFADSPTEVVELLRTAHVARSPDLYRALFADDFVFAFSATDSAGNAFRDSLWRRDDELLYAQHLFVSGKGGEEAATSITLDFAAAPIAVPDPRPGKDPRWHRYLNVDVVLVVRRASGDFEIKGAAKFFVTRGDSAHIPSDLGVGPDSTRWYIERWEDDTAASAALSPDLLSAQPASRTSWGQIKSLYR